MGDDFRPAGPGSLCGRVFRGNVGTSGAGFVRGGGGKRKKTVLPAKAASLYKKYLERRGTESASGARGR